MNYISLWEIHRNFRVKVIGAENIKTTEEDNSQLYITAGLYIFFPIIFKFFLKISWW